MTTSKTESQFLGKFYELPPNSTPEPEPGPQWLDCPQKYGEQAWNYTPPSSRGYLLMEVLPFLIGRPLDDVAKGYIHSLRPSVVRILRNGGRTLSSCTWRVNISLGADDKIQKIDQEVEVGLYGDIHNGHELRCDLNGMKRPARTTGGIGVTVANVKGIARVNFL